MLDFGPLLDDILVAVRPETESYVTGISGVVQANASQLDARGLVRACDAIVEQGCRSVPVRMNQLYSWFPNITVACLRIRLVVSQELCIRIRAADRKLVKPAVVSHLKVHGEAFSS